MSMTLVLVPESQLNCRSTWDRIVVWQKSVGTPWERLRVTMDFFRAGHCDRELLRGVLDLVRAGRVQDLVYCDLSEEQAKNPDWLAFVVSLQSHHVTVSVMGEQTFDLPQALDRLVQSFLQVDSMPRAAQSPSSPASVSLNRSRQIS